MPRHPSLAGAATLLAAAIALASPVAAQGTVRAQGSGSRGAFSWEYEIAPDELAKGGTALLVLRIEGMSSSSLRVEELRLGPGLELETQATRPYVIKGGDKGAELRLGFVLRESGKLLIESLVLSSKEGRLEIGAIALAVGEPGAPGGGLSARPAIWVWKAPATAHRFEAFEVRLERADGGASKGLTASFPAPAKATIEASGYLSWTVVALAEGALVLPDATLLPGRGSATRPGEAEAVSIRISALPRAIASSRALGDFALRLSGPDPSEPVAGEAVRLELILEGSGNFPCLVLPAPEILLDGEALPREAWSAKRVDDYRASARGYSGSARSIVVVESPRPGDLVLRFPPLAVLGPGGVTRLLSAGPLEVALRAPGAGLNGEPGGSGKPGKIGEGASNAGANEVQAASAPPAAPLDASPESSAEPKEGPPRDAPPGFGPTARRAAELYDRGEVGASLASLYMTMRRGLPFERAYREARAASREIAAALSPELGKDEPLLDPLPPPKAFLVPAAALALAAAASLAAALLGRKRRRVGAQGRPRAAAFLFAAAIALGALAGAAALERRESYAVVWTEELSLIPSPAAELRIRAPLGSTARLRGEYSGYASLSFADGVEAWAPSSSTFRY